MESHILQRQRIERYYEAIEWARLNLPISKAEFRVVKLIAEGKSHQETSDTLHISILTVETHLAHIRGKLGFHRDTQIVNWYIRYKYSLIDMGITSLILAI